MGVRGKVEIDAFRLISPQRAMFGYEPRQTTSNMGNMKRPTGRALFHGLNKHYYSINIGYRKEEFESKMLMNLHKKTWTDGFHMDKFNELGSKNAKSCESFLDLTQKYNKRLET